MEFQWNFHFKDGLRDCLDCLDLPWQVNDEDRYALLVVDSIMGGFRVDYSGRGELADRQQKLAKVMNKLQKAGWKKHGLCGSLVFLQKTFQIFVLKVHLLKC